MWNILQGDLDFQLWCFQLNFVCLDNFTVTLPCLLVSLLFHCYFAVSFFLLNLSRVLLTSGHVMFLSQTHKHNHSPLWKSITRYQSTLNTIFAASLVSCPLYFLLKMFDFFFFFMPHEICICEVKGTRQWRLFLWRAFFVLMCLSTLLLLLWNAWSRGATMINYLLIANSVICISCIIGLLTSPSSLSISHSPTVLLYLFCVAWALVSSLKTLQSE